MAEVGVDYAKFQISASEALRAGAAEGLGYEERIRFFIESQMWSQKAFLAARQNVYARVLALDQYQCAAGLILLARNEYNSVVVSDVPAENAMGRD